jgi:hypothetical protein
VRALDKPGWALGAWALALVIWGTVPVIQYVNSWQERGIGVVIAIAFGGGFGLVMRSGFKRVAARPPAFRGVDRWLARLPTWLSAPLIICAYMAAPVAIVVGTAWHFHRLPAESVWGLSGMFICACGWGGFWLLAWRVQRRRQDLTEAARG